MLTSILPTRTLPDPWEDPLFSHTQAAALLAQPGSFLFAGAGQGHLLARILPGEPADILTFFVAPASRRQGLATALLHAAIQQARVAGCPTLVLEVRASNTAALALYQKTGFTLLTTRPNYYRHPPEDALVLTLKLEPSA